MKGAEGKVQQSRKIAKVMGNSAKFALYMLGRRGQNSLATY